MNTFGRAFLGLSVECARCHDHKYDPITQKEYFRLFSFFNNVNETGQIPVLGRAEPDGDRDDAGGRTRRSPRSAAQIARARSELDPRARRRSTPASRAGSRRRPARRARAVAHAARPDRAPAARGAGARHRVPEADPKNPPKPGAPKPKPSELLDLREPRDAKERGRGGDKDRPPKTVPGRVGEAQQLVGDSYITAGKTVAFFERNQPFSFGLWFRIDRAGTSGPLVTRSGGVMNGHRGYEIMLRADGTLTAGLHHVAPDNSIEIETTSR